MSEKNTNVTETPEIDPGMSVMPEGPGLMDVPTVIPELGLAAQALASQVSFAKKTWKDGSGGGTPVTAAELNRLEQGVADLTAAVNGLRDSVSQCATIGGSAKYAQVFSHDGSEGNLLSVRATSGKSSIALIATNQGVTVYDINNQNKIGTCRFD